MRCTLVSRESRLRAVPPAGLALNDRVLRGRETDGPLPLLGILERLICEHLRSNLIEGISLNIPMKSADASPAGIEKNVA